MLLLRPGLIEPRHAKSDLKDCLAKRFFFLGGGGGKTSIVCEDIRATFFEQCHIKKKARWVNACHSAMAELSFGMTITQCNKGL